jgi:site-specific DNA-cytosine methylase
VAAWRVLDLQHFGPPQRRRRVFVLAARTGGCDPAEILALSEGVCGHPSPRSQAREGAARGATAGIRSSSAINISNGEPRLGDTFATLQARSKAGGIGSGQQMQAVLTYGIDQERNTQAELMGTLNTGSKTGGGQLPVVMVLDERNQAVSEDVHHMLIAGGMKADAVIAFESTGGSWGVNEGDTSPPIKIGTGLGIASPPAVLSFQNTGQGWWNEADTAQTLRTPCGGDSTLANVVCTTGHVTHALTHEGADASEDGTGRGTPIVAYSRGGFGDWTQADAVTALCARDHKDQSSIVLPALPASLENSGTGHNKDELIIAQHGQANATFDREVSPTLTCLHEQPYLVKKEWPKEIADTLTVAYAEKWGLEDQHINSGAGLFQPTATGRPRRLTPLECERLMGWADDWTADGVKSDGTVYALSDTARYRLCGNGVGSPVAQWIAERWSAL